MSTKIDKKKLREEKKQAAKSRDQRNALLFKVAAVIMVVLTVYVFSQGLFGGAPVYAPDEIAESDHVRGNVDAPLTITVYADFQCPSCLSEVEMIASAWARIRDDVRLVYRYFPLDTHRHAFLSARYVEAASKQDSFWPMHDIVFANQSLWSSLADVEPIFDGYAEQLGLDIEQLHLDLESDEVRDKILADQQGGIRAGVRGTPVMFFNGLRVNNPRTAGELARMVSDAIEG